MFPKRAFYSLAEIHLIFHFHWCLSRLGCIS